MITDEDEWANTEFMKDCEDVELMDDLIELPRHVQDEYSKIIEERNRRTFH